MLSRRTAEVAIEGTGQAVQEAAAGPATETPARRRGLLRGAGLRMIGLLGVLLLLVLGCLFSLRLGAATLPTRTVLDAFLSFDGSYGQTIVRELRLPRTVIGLVVGAALGITGAIMQAVTRSPLAESGLLGINAGAAFAVVTAIYLLGANTPGAYMWFAFPGALAATALVYLVGTAGSSGATPVKLALAGVVITALLGSWTTALLVLSRQTLDESRFWLAGSLAGRELEPVLPILPVLLVGLVLGLCTARQLNALTLGDDVARALGVRTTRIRVVCSLIVVLLAGAAVAIAGPIGFVGLAVPHIARLLTGPDYRWVLGYSVLLGPLLLLTADVVGRLVLRPAELEVGIITAVIGTPLLIYLARRRKLSTV